LALALSQTDDIVSQKRIWRPVPPDESGEVFGLDVAAGKLTKIADSEAEFRELAASQEKRAEWFREAAEQSALARGLKPDATQCIGLA
jgi:hypothetical protein